MMVRPRLAIPASVVVDDRIHRDEQNHRFWSGVFSDALAHRAPQQGQLQIRHIWPRGYPPRRRQKALCGASGLPRPSRREPSEMCVVCQEVSA